MARITYTEDFAGQTTFLAQIAKQNAELGSKSPLIVHRKEHDWDFDKLVGLAKPATE